MNADRRPERCPERGLKERRSRLPRKTATASGESRQRELAGWGESGIGAARSDAPVDTHGAIGPIDTMESKRADSICRTAVYVTRMHGGVGGRGREVPSYPD